MFVVVIKGDFNMRVTLGSSVFLQHLYIMYIYRGKYYKNSSGRKVKYPYLMPLPEGVFFT